MKKYTKTTFKKRVIDVEQRNRSILSYLLVVLMVITLSVAGTIRFSIIGEGESQREEILIADNEEEGDPRGLSDNTIGSIKSQHPYILLTQQMELEELMEQFQENIEKANQEASIEEIEVETEVVEETVEETEPEITYVMELNSNERAILEQIVEAEVTGDEKSFRKANRQEVLESKIRVAQVVLNRVQSKEFPNTVEGCVFQKRQFSPISDGRYYRVSVCDLTKEAVELALREDTPSYSQGALYFTAGRKCGAKASYLFTDPVGHSFFK